MKGKTHLLFAFILLLPLILTPHQTNAATTEAPFWHQPIHYVALGDSLAFGIDSNGNPGKGYADYLAESLSQNNSLVSANKGFSVPGYKATDVLRDLRTDVTKQVIGVGLDVKEAELQNSISTANLITISAGANDVLPYFKLDPKTGLPAPNMEQLMAAIKQVGATYHQILAKIYELNPDVQVYVMGYYNPYPHLDSTIQPQINQLVDGLNESIQAGMKGTSAKFIPTSAHIAKNAKTYLPNPASIHLNEEGYKVIANLFSEQLSIHYPWIPQDTLMVEAMEGTVYLTWNPVATDNAATYSILMNEEQIAEVPGDVLSYPITHLEPGTYTFSIIAANEAGQTSSLNPLSIIHIDRTEDLATFSDINNHWAKDFIQRAHTKGLVNGYADGTFRPDGQLTRAQAAVIFVRALDLSPTKPTPFTDLKNYADVTKANIAAAYEHGLVKGTNSEFRPNEPVTRAQFALMVKRAYEQATGQPYKAAGPVPFSDIAVYHQEAQTAMTMLAELGIANGNSGRFMPGDSTTRAHAAKILVNALNILEK